MSEVFKKRFPGGDLFFIQRGRRQVKARLQEWGRVQASPGPMADRRHFRHLLAKAPADALMNCGMHLDLLRRIKPDLFVTEFFPLGNEECRHSLIPPLVQAFRQGALLWAVAGYPLLTGASHGWREKILGLYQRIIIFSPPSEKEYMARQLPFSVRRAYLDFFDRHASKITFAGYLLPQQNVIRQDEGGPVARPSIPRGACKVAVLRGGGAVYPKVIAQAIRASELLGNEYFWTGVAGPSTTLQEWRYFTKLAAQKKTHNLLLMRAVRDYEGLIAQSDVCVSLASYHTSVMLLKYHKKSVVVPFAGYGDKSIQEQLARAALLKERIGAEIIPIQALTAAHLKSAVQKAAASPPQGRPLLKAEFGGREFFDKVLVQQLNHAKP